MNIGRSYTMVARAATTQATRDRIVGVMGEMILDRWYDEITLRDVADRAGVALQTVMNHFGSKEGVLAAVLEDPRMGQRAGGHRWKVAPDDVGAAVKGVVSDYENVGDGVIRALALEERIPAVQPLLAAGREGHRRWVEQAFPGALRGIRSRQRARKLNLLICATDVYTWRLLRRDMGLSKQEAEVAMTELVEALYVR